MEQYFMSHILWYLQQKIAADWLSKSNRFQAFPPCLTRHLCGRRGRACGRTLTLLCSLYVMRLSLTRVTKSYLLALGTSQISSYFTKHGTKFLTHQTGNIIERRVPRKHVPHDNSTKVSLDGFETKHVVNKSQGIRIFC